MEPNFELSSQISNSNLPPKNIFVNQFKLSIKNKNIIKGNFYSYCCKNRANCNGLSHFKKDDLICYIDNPIFILTPFKTINEHSAECYNSKDFSKDNNLIKKTIEYNISNHFLFIKKKWKNREFY